MEFTQERQDECLVLRNIENIESIALIMSNNEINEIIICHQWISINYSSYTFLLLRLSLFLPVGASLCSSLCPFEVSHRLKTSTASLISGTTGCFRFILNIPCPRPECRHSSREPFSFKEEMMYWKYNMNAEDYSKIIITLRPFSRDTASICFSFLSINGKILIWT